MIDDSEFMWCIANCLTCKRPFGFNPDNVPSHWAVGGEAVMAGTPGAVLHPICEPCIRGINAKRRELGHDEWPVAANAYQPTGLVLEGL